METIRTAAAPSALGWVLVAATRRGLCALLLGNDVAALQADLQRRWPRAAIVAGDDLVQAWAQQAAAYVAKPGCDWAPPLDVRGTPFQQGVWALLRGIPPGQMITYGALAARLGNPRAARAVDAAETDRAMVEELERRMAEISGVNMDEELARLVLYQQAYSVSARIVQITDELFDELMSIGR
jgi:O6-methylguanine-DNA--protein-cysteine methyltransferase